MCITDSAISAGSQTAEMYEQELRANSHVVTLAVENSFSSRSVRVAGAVCANT